MDQIKHVELSARRCNIIKDVNEPVENYRIMLGVSLCSLLLISIVSCDKTPTTASQQSSPQAIESPHPTDRKVEARIRSALLFEQSTASAQIAVTVTNGDARLTGEVDTQQQLDQVLKLIKTVQGVHTIHDELSVKK